jgi:hypothetical protein
VAESALTVHRRLSLRDEPVGGFRDVGAWNDLGLVDARLVGVVSFDSFGYVIVPAGACKGVPRRKASEGRHGS